MQIAFDLESTALAGEGGSNYETLRSLAPADSRGKDSLSISQSVRAFRSRLAPAPADDGCAAEMLRVGVIRRPVRASLLACLI
jgi:hypothetical protein